MSKRLNVSDRLFDIAEKMPEAIAIAFPREYESPGRRRYEQETFAEFATRVDHYARGFLEMGIQPGMRIALLVKPSIDFVALVFALLRCGAVQVLIDPGMGKRNLLGCLDDVEPEGFVAISPVQAVRTLLLGRYRKSTFNVTAGRRWFWGGLNLRQLRKLGRTSRLQMPETTGEDPAAIIFTTGSTGPPKGVLYTHRIFDTQVTEIRDRYAIEPGEIDLPGFPLFGLFNCAMGVTTVLPDMDPTRPAEVDPKKIIEAVDQWQVTQSFGSPAIWNRIGEYCQRQKVQMPSLRRVLSAGAPVPVNVLRSMTTFVSPGCEMHTPYGATESLPIATISANEVLRETAEQTSQGAGVCVGSRFSTVRWKVIAIEDGALETIDQVEELPTGEIGELIVSGPQVTREYVTRVHWNRLAKIADGDTFWHRMGDVGYLDPQDRFWFCGRKGHRVQTHTGTLFTISCEAIFNRHPRIFRTALVGLGEVGEQLPVLIAEPQQNVTVQGATSKEQIAKELYELGQAHPHTAAIRHFLLRPQLPVDIRHNAKIFREKLSLWAAKQPLIEVGNSQAGKIG